MVAIYCDVGVAAAVTAHIIIIIIIINHHPHRHHYHFHYHYHNYTWAVVNPVQRKTNTQACTLRTCLAFGIQLLTYFIMKTTEFMSQQLLRGA